MRLASAFGRRPRLPLVASAKLRIAMLDASACFEGARRFPPEQWSSLGAFSPNIIAGSWAHLQRLMDRAALQTVNLGALDHSIFVLTQLGDTALPETHRERLWRRFKLPVYELYLDERGRLLAFECEAREGWHVKEGVAFTTDRGELLLKRHGRMVRTGLDWVMSSAVCCCGRPGARIMPRQENIAAAGLPQLVYG